jgi:hypothetical protein
MLLSRKDVGVIEMNEGRMIESGARPVKGSGPDGSLEIDTPGQYNDTRL